MVAAVFVSANAGAMIMTPSMKIWVRDPKARRSIVRIIISDIILKIASGHPENIKPTIGKTTDFLREIP